MAAAPEPSSVPGREQGLDHHTFLLLTLPKSRHSPNVLSFGALEILQGRYFIPFFINEKERIVSPTVQ